MIQFDFSYYIYGHIHDIRKLIWIDKDHVVMASPVFLMDLIKRILQGKISMSLSYEMETSRAWQTYSLRIMAHPAGIEPATLGFGGRYSIP